MKYVTGLFALTMKYIICLQQYSICFSGIHINSMEIKRQNGIQNYNGRNVTTRLRKLIK